MATPSENKILRMLQDVVAIESINPGFPGGSRGEAAMLDYLLEFCGAAGFTTQTFEVLPGRSNFIARLEGQNPSRQIMFECHMDTVSVDNMTIPPFEPEIRDGKLYGRGSCDTKAGGVAMLHAMKRIKESGKKPPLTILYAGAIDEENTMKGAAHLAGQVKPEAVVVSEPTQLKVIRAHKGLMRFRIHVTGKQVHGALADQGINAITKMSRLLIAIEDGIRKSYARKSHDLLGSPIFNIGLITGGTQINFVPAECTATIECRIIPGHPANEVFSEFKNIAAEAMSKDADLKVRFEEPYITTAPMETSEDSFLVQSALAAVRDVTGTAAIAGAPYVTDGGFFSAVGIPTIVLGPGNIEQAHREVEWVDCEQVLAATDVYQKMMENFS